VTRLQGTLELATQSRWYGRPAEASDWPFPATRTGTQKSPSTARPANTDFYYWELDVIILGLILLIIGFIAHIAIVWTIGIIVLVVGAILALLGMMGHAVGGRRHYF
jgi:small-conductance mechanosensitive channel